jgi:hypothetical protein
MAALHNDAKGSSVTGACLDLERVLHKVLRFVLLVSADPRPMDGDNKGEFLVGISTPAFWNNA